MSNPKPHVLLMGQTPPPWHGQAVATKILFDHDWPGYDVHRLRMEFSEEMVEVGRFQWKKLGHLFHLILKAREILKANPACLLFYPPASAKWIPFLRDVAFLACVRRLAGSTVFIFHASGLPVFVRSGLLRRLLGRWVYRGADLALEVAEEAVPPHEVFAAKAWQWCPCAIEVPELGRRRPPEPGPMTVLFVGSLQEGKGVLEVLKTASLLKQQGREQDFRFRIVGKWFLEAFEAEARQLQTTLGVADMVEFVGQLTGEEKWRAYAESDVFFFPTHYGSEATPIVLMEALGAGLPIVSTSWAGIPAMLEGCKTARLLPVRAPELYATAFVELFSRRGELSQTAEASRTFYRTHFLPERFVERVAEAFRTVGDSRRALQTVSEARMGADAGSATPGVRPPGAPLSVTVYLADQNPGYDRSFGISRMSHVVLETLQAGGQVKIGVIASKTSQQAPGSVEAIRILPWGTRGKWVRLLTDHFHPLFGRHRPAPDLHYFPKGYLPLLDGFCRPSVVTIHDTIIQYDEDHYPEWRKSWEYAYWAMMLKHTLRKATCILTVSEFSKQQITEFMARHRIPRKEIIVTYEPCLYERVPQPELPTKDNFVIHLASCEPHKRTAHLIRWWHAAEATSRELPTLHLIGAVPPEVLPLLAGSNSIVKRPFLEDAALRAAYLAARALILPSEIEGFGLPALEAYYLGTPVCYVKGTSVEEILGVATAKGGFSLGSADSLFAALDEVAGMTADEIRACGLKLRGTYAAAKVARRMTEVFREVGNND
ncbi:MAG: glycosyltransferase [Verrucomicrobia bacterium]|nr:glycosyltransferase [Verrucomicrobiota bacterium]